MYFERIVAAPPEHTYYIYVCGGEGALPYRQEFSVERDMYTIFVDGELLKEIQVVEIEQE